MSVLTRRTALALAAASFAAGARAQGRGAATTDGDRAVWYAFRDRFLASEGRVVDTGNQGVSHTEGQGWGMLFALAADDRGSFDRMLDWSRRVLRRRGDQLFSWRFKPQGGGVVDDPNNATDGDLCIAWALLQAGERWGNAEHTQQAHAMGRDILRLLVRRVGRQTVLLPGARGFDKAESVIVNPSYLVFPAIRALALALPDPAWLRVAADCIVLMRRASFGRWGLPPDWVEVQRADGRLSLPGNWQPRFSYDAVRVPLYLAWSGLVTEPGYQNAARFWTDPSHRQLPAWTDLTSNSLSPYAANPGIAAVARLVTRRGGGEEIVRTSTGRGLEGQDYYSAALTMLVRLAARDSIIQSS